MRALERPPADLERPWRPWLTRVAVNLGRDLLRRRRRQPTSVPGCPGPYRTAADGLPCERSIRAGTWRAATTGWRA